MTTPRETPRVLHLSTRLEGGVETVARMIEAGLADDGIASDHRVLIAPGAGPREIGFAVLRAAWAVLSGRYDAIFAYQSAAALLMAVLGTLRGVPIRASHLTALPEGLMDRWVWLDALAGRAGLYTHIVANCEATAKAYGAYPDAYRARIVTIPHGVSPLPPSPEPADWRAGLGLSPNALLLVATGRLADQKDHATAIRALPRIPDACLAIAGDGPRRDALVALAEAEGVADRLHLLGALPRAALHDLVAQADAYLFPSVWESFGLAGVEALMAGTPVVAADHAVLREVLEIDGIVPSMTRFHAVGDAAGLAREVRRTLRHPPTRAIRRGAARLAVAHHAPAHMARRYRDLLARDLRDQAVARPGPGRFASPAGRER